MSRFPRAGLTAVGVAPLLQVRVALQAAIGRRDVLRGAWDGRLGHDRVGVWRLVHGLQLQPLVVDPQVGWLQVFGVALVFVGTVGRLGSGSLPAAERAGGGEGDERLNSLTEEEEEAKEPVGQQGKKRSKFSRGILLFLVRCGAPRAQEGPHHHHNDGESAHGDDDDNDQDVILAAASDP